MTLYSRKCIAIFVWITMVSSGPLASAFSPRLASLSKTTSAGSKTEQFLYVDDKVTGPKLAPAGQKKDAKETIDEEGLDKPRPHSLFLLEKALRTVENPFAAALPKTRVSSPHPSAKEHLVILGSGWGSISLLKKAEITENFDVTVISPRNCFVFTPLLAGASVGSYEVRTIAEPIREANLDAKYLEAKALSVDTRTRTIACLGQQQDGLDEEFAVPYDRLVVAVGAKVNTFGIPGVEEHCSFLKQLEDARKIRRKIVHLFERANYPGVTEEQRKQLLTFAIIGAGPSGVELASELKDFLEEDGPKFYPDLLKYVSIKLIDAGPTILQPFAPPLQEAAKEELTHETTNGLKLVEIILNQMVKEVKKSSIVFSDGQELVYGLAVWAGGIGPLQITQDIIDSLGGAQADFQSQTRGRVAVDPWLRAAGGNNRIFALGDCACNPKHPLPATAQVASQQGSYLASFLAKANFTHGAETDNEMEHMPVPHRKDSAVRTGADRVASMGMACHDDHVMIPFQYLDMGILAYTGKGSALAQLKAAPNVQINAKGKVGFGLWQSIYLYKQASMRNRWLVSLDWIKSRVFGRDITEIE